MKVKQLIAALKKMPQQLEVNFRAHDLNYFEIDGTVFSVNLIVKEEVLKSENLSPMEIDCLQSRPSKWVCLG